MKILAKNESLFGNLSQRIQDQSQSVSLYEACDFPTGAHSAIAVSEGLRSNDLVHQFIEKEVRHWVQSNENWFEQDLLQAGSFCESPKKYFEEDAFAPNSITSHKISISSKEEKPRLKEEVSNFAKSTLSQNAMDSAEIIAEELYMNAFLDAPREAEKLGFPVCQYGAQMKATMELYRYEDKLLMTMIDPFGSLDCWKFIKRMDQVYKMGAGEVLNRGPGGAGLGCVIIFENCASLFLGVDRQVQTKVSCVIPLGFSNRQRDKIAKGLHRIDLHSK